MSDVSSWRETAIAVAGHGPARAAMVAPVGVLHGYASEDLEARRDTTRFRDVLAAMSDDMVELNRQLQEKLRLERDRVAGRTIDDDLAEAFPDFDTKSRVLAELCGQLTSYAVTVARRQQRRYRIASVTYRLVWLIAILGLAVGVATSALEDAVGNLVPTWPGWLVVLSVSVVTLAAIQGVVVPFADLTAARWWWRALWEEVDAVLTGTFFAAAGLLAIDRQLDIWEDIFALSEHRARSGRRWAQRVMTRWTALADRQVLYPPDTLSAWFYDPSGETISGLEEAKKEDEARTSYRQLLETGLPRRVSRRALEAHPTQPEGEYSWLALQRPELFAWTDQLRREGKLQASSTTDTVRP